MMDETRDRIPDQRDHAQPAIEPVEERNGDAKKTMQRLRRHAVSDLSILIAEAIPLVVSAVEPHRQSAARLQILGQGFNRLFTVRSVMEHPHAVNAVESFR